jgi:hypothetical protein
MSPNFALDHVYGAPAQATKATGLGGMVDGVLGEYMVFPEHVSKFWIHIIRSSKSSKEREDNKEETERQSLS